jgi:hypothetical protein
VHMYVIRVTLLSDFDDVRGRTKIAADARVNSKHKLRLLHQYRLGVCLGRLLRGIFRIHSPARRCATTLYTSGLNTIPMCVAEISTSISGSPVRQTCQSRIPSFFV